MQPDINSTSNCQVGGLLEPTGSLSKSPFESSEMIRKLNLSIETPSGVGGYSNRLTRQIRAASSRLISVGSSSGSLTDAEAPPVLVKSSQIVILPDESVDSHSVNLC